MEDQKSAFSSSRSRRQFLQAAGALAGAAALSGRAAWAAQKLQGTSSSGPAVNDQVNWQEFLAQQDLVWDRLPRAYQAGAFVGNGLLGAMIYSDKDCPMRWDLGRSDVADHQGTTDGANAYFCRQRLPIGHFILETVGKPTGGTMRVVLWDAEAVGTLETDKGKIHWRSFVHTTELAIVIELHTEGGEQECRWKWVPGVAKIPNKYHPSFYKPDPPSKIEKIGEMNICLQPLGVGLQHLVGGEYATAWREITVTPGHRVLFASIGNSLPFNAGYRRYVKGGQPWPRLSIATDEAVAGVKKAVATGLPALVATQRTWWHRFYPTCFVSLPDARVLSDYWIDIYKLASGTRPDRPAIDIEGPWYHHKGNPYSLFWWNVDSLWPFCASNRLELGESQYRMFDRNYHNLIRNVKNFNNKNCTAWQADSAFLGRTTSFDLRSPWGENGNLMWVLFDYYSWNRCTMDDQRLRKKLFPLLRRATNLFLHLMFTGPDGRLHLPIDFSPEYGSSPDTNYDLALFRWGCQTLLKICHRLKIKDPLIPKWREVLERLTNYPQEAGVLWVGAGMPLSKGHRHYSHLLMIYPLHTMNWGQRENRALMTRSVDHYINMGSLNGWSHASAAALLVAAQRPNDALDQLNLALDSLQANTFYAESGSIGACMYEAVALQEFLLQSWGGTIVVFPGIPDTWNEVTIHNMRAEGAFLVSAVRKEGKTRWVRVESLLGEPCRVRTDLAEPVKVYSGRRVVMRQLADGVVELDLKKGEAAVLYCGDKVPDLTIAPVKRQTGVPNHWGSPKPGCRNPQPFPM